MSNAKNTSAASANRNSIDASVRPSISASRWTSRSTRPKLVSFSWAGVALASTQR